MIKNNLQLHELLVVWQSNLHCIAEIRAYWVEPKPFQIDNAQHHYQIA